MAITSNITAAGAVDHVLFVHKFSFEFLMGVMHLLWDLPGRHCAPFGVSLAFFGTPCPRGRLGAPGGHGRQKH